MSVVHYPFYNERSRGVQLALRLFAQGFPFRFQTAAESFGVRLALLLRLFAQGLQLTVRLGAGGLQGGFPGSLGFRKQLLCLGLGGGDGVFGFLVPLSSRS